MSAMYVVENVICHLPALAAIVVGLALIVLRLSREPQRAYWFGVAGLIGLGLLHLTSPVASHFIIAWMNRWGASPMSSPWLAYAIVSSLMNGAALACLVAAVVMRRG